MNEKQKSEVLKAIRRKRHELEEIREEIDDLIDYLDVLEARARDNGKPRLTHAAVKNRYRVR